MNQQPEPRDNNAVSTMSNAESAEDDHIQNTGEEDEKETVVVAAATEMVQSVSAGDETPTRSKGTSSVTDTRGSEDDGSADRGDDDAHSAQLSDTRPSAEEPLSCPTMEEPERHAPAATSTPSVSKRPHSPERRTQPVTPISDTDTNTDTDTHTSPAPPSNDPTGTTTGTTTADAPTCWICYDSESSEANPLMTPCKCKGTVQHVHESCLLQWLTTSETCVCLHCHHELQLEVSYPSKLQKLLDIPSVPTAIAVVAVLTVLCAFHRTFMWFKARITKATRRFWEKRCGGTPNSGQHQHPSSAMFGGGGGAPSSPDIVTMLASSFIPGGSMLFPMLMHGYNGRPSPTPTTIRVPFFGELEPGMVFVEMQLFVVALCGLFTTLKWVGKKMPTRDERSAGGCNMFVRWCGDSVERIVDTVHQELERLDTPEWLDSNVDLSFAPQVDTLRLFYMLVLRAVRSVHTAFVNKTRRVCPYVEQEKDEVTTPPSPQQPLTSTLTL
jgi:hypothetical protein